MKSTIHFELVAMGEARRFLDVPAGRVRTGERDVLGRSCRRQEVVLQHHTELASIVGEP